jgi:hypothetical protein
MNNTILEDGQDKTCPAHRVTEVLSFEILEGILAKIRIIRNNAQKYARIL